ncbi:MAG TPA: AMP-binding protein, partial [bacterium]|nr:AMP-binding protein [bacterium]
MRKILLILLLLAMIRPCPAQSADFDAAVTLLRSWIGEKMSCDGIPGLAAGVVADGRLVWAEGFGYADLAAKMIKKRPNFLIGVPTLYEALNKSEKFNRSDLSCLYACFSGADTLPRTVKERFESIVERQGGKGVKLLEGYGLTEAVTAIMAMPLGEYREG